MLVRWQLGCGRRRGDRRGQGSQCFNYSGSLLVPRNGPLPVVLKHSHPLSLHVLCKCQKQNLCPKRRRAGSYWWSTISGPNLPTPRFFYGNPTRVNSQQCGQTRASSLFYGANPTALSWHAFSPGRESSKKHQLSMWKYGDGVCSVVFPDVFTSVSSTGGALPPLSPQAPHAPLPLPRVRVLPSAGVRHSLPVDALVTVGHVQKIVFLVVVLGEEVRRRFRKHHHIH